jgi:hypothetical protein
MTVHLVGFLAGVGHPVTFAATVAGLLGILSVTGRLILTGAQRRVRMHRVVAAIFTVQAGAALSLPFVGDTRLGAVLAVTGFGIGFGVASLATPALLADRYGTTAYASIAGNLAAPRHLRQGRRTTGRRRAGCRRRLHPGPGHHRRLQPRRRGRDPLPRRLTRPGAARATGTGSLYVTGR